MFVVPGDYNLPLLDGLALVPGLTLVRPLRPGPRASCQPRSRALL